MISSQQLLLPILALTSFIAKLPAQMVVEPIGIRLVKKHYPSEDFQKSIRPLNSEKGLSLAFELRSPEANLISLNTDDSKISSIKDDQGKELMKGEPDFFFFGQPKVSEDSKVLVFEANPKELPNWK